MKRETSVNNKPLYNLHQNVTWFSNLPTYKTHTIDNSDEQILEISSYFIKIDTSNNSYLYL